MSRFCIYAQSSKLTKQNQNISCSQCQQHKIQIICLRNQLFILQKQKQQQYSNFDGIQQQLLTIKMKYENVLNQLEQYNIENSQIKAQNIQILKQNTILQKQLIQMKQTIPSIEITKLNFSSSSSNSSKDILDKDLSNHENILKQITNIDKKTSTIETFTKQTNKTQYDHSYLLKRQEIQNKRHLKLLQLDLLINDI